MCILFLVPRPVFTNGKKYFEIEKDETQERDDDGKQEINVLFVNLKYFLSISDVISY